MAAKVDTPKIDEDWQLNKSLAECNRHMLENGIATDVTFLVSDERTDSDAETFSAHKYVLISRSPVIYSMLCAVLAERGEIRVTDVHPEAFRQMLNYIYTEDQHLSMDLLPHVINTSKKYLLSGLKTRCAEFLKAHLTTENVCTILAQILLFEENDLNEICLNFIEQETKKVLESEAFMTVSRDALSKILDINTCELKEVDVFKACLKWARQKCVEEEKEASGINIREALGDCVTRLRFSEIGDFAREVCPAGVLTKDDEHGILCHLADRQAIPAPPGFNCEARLRPIYKVLTAEEIQPKKFNDFNFHISIDSKNKTDIKVKTILISNVFSDRGSSFTIQYNNQSISGEVSSTQDEKKLQFKCNSQLVIKPGSSYLQILYHYMNSTFGNHQSLTDRYVYVVPKSEITLKDGDRIELHLRLNNKYDCIPLLGLTYQLDF